MPMEGQAGRTVLPLRPRDRKFLIAFGLVAALAIAAGAVYAATRGSGPAGPCITASFPASMGGATVHHCGTAAAHFCRFDANVVQIVEACRNAGFPVGRKQ
jgi:hypothetical protein